MRRNAGVDLHLVMLLFDVSTSEAVEPLTLLYFLEGDKLVEGGLADRNDLL